MAPTFVPETEPVVVAYARALESGDAAELYGMLSAESRRSVSRAELERILGEQKNELVAHAREVREGSKRTAAEANLRFADGEVVSLALEGGNFRVASADALPGAARTPSQALGELRRVLARRSYAGLLRVLSPATRAAMERDLRSLVDGLAEPDALPIEVVGDAAVVVLPGGHEVKLRREDGVWHVDDFD